MEKMENKKIIVTSPNKKENNKINSVPLTPKCSKQQNIILSINKNINSCLKSLYCTSKKLLTSNKNNFNNHQNNSNNNFLIPYPINSISKTNLKQKNTISLISRTEKKSPLPKYANLMSAPKKLFTSKIQLSQIKQIPNEINKSFLNKKRKYMSSEEIELEQIEKEKTASKKLMEKNRSLYYKSFKYTPIKIIPTPLTTFKPFNLSSNKNSKYLKEGKSNTLYEINKLNQKIRQRMQQKIEVLTDTKTKNEILLNNTDYLKKQNMLYNDLFKEIKGMNNFGLNNNNQIKNNLDENEDISNFNKKYMTPHKNNYMDTDYKKRMNIFESLNKGNFNSCFSTQIKKYTERNKGFGSSKIINYYMTNSKNN